jgi:hypothetical protein
MRFGFLSLRARARVYGKFWFGRKNFWFLVSQQRKGRRRGLAIHVGEVGSAWMGSAFRAESWNRTVRGRTKNYWSNEQD